MVMYNHRMMSRAYAVCVLIQDAQGRILAISRPNNRQDFGLIGGGVEQNDGDLRADPDGTLRRAAVRELWEEAGIRLQPHQLKPVYRAQARRRFATVFIPTVQPDPPKLGHNEEGWVAWVEPERICQGSFGPYNRKLLDVLQKD